MKPLNLLYVHGAGMGYGRLGVKLAESLADMDVDIYDRIPLPHEPRRHSEGLLARGDKPMPHFLATNTLKETDGKREGICGTACWVSVPVHAAGWWKGQKVCIFTMFEATRLPESFRETLHNFDTVIVPSPQNVELFGQYHDNVKLVPLGVDPAQWHYTPRKPVGRYFNFLIGGSGKRKGTDLAYRAFRTVFPRPPKTGPIPRLILKNPKGEEYVEHNDERYPIILDEQCEMIAGKITGEDEIALYEQAHCYLQPSRGEGFGLQPLQAMAQGLPTILTNAHGHESFAHLGIPLGYSMSKAAYFIFGDAGQWWEPGFEELCEAMWEVYSNYEPHREAAHQSALKIGETFTWEHTARNFLDALGELKEYDGPHEWVDPEVKRFRARLVKPWACSIAGASYQFEGGKDYWIFADVKRVLWEAGLLDPECCGDEDGGLSPEQVAQIEEYTATHGYCMLCNQKLGSGVHKSDEIYAEMTG